MARQAARVKDDALQIPLVLLLENSSSDKLKKTKDFWSASIWLPHPVGAFQFPELLLIQIGD